MGRLLLAALLPALALLLRPALAADQFNPAQRAEIVQIIRDALKHDPSILQDAVASLQNEAATQRNTSEAAAIAAHRNELVTPADPVAGNPHGDVTIVEFFDTNCAYCRKLNPVIADLLASDHNVRLIYKDLPILGPSSVLGARALMAAQRQGGYVSLHDALMRDPPGVTLDTIRAHAAALGLDWARMQRDMSDPAVQQRIASNLAMVPALGIQGTPTMVIGDTLVPGAVDLAELQNVVAAARSGSPAATAGR